VLLVNIPTLKLTSNAQSVPHKSTKTIQTRDRVKIARTENSNWPLANFRAKRGASAEKVKCTKSLSTKTGCGKSTKNLVKRMPKTTVTSAPRGSFQMPISVLRASLDSTAGNVLVHASCVSQGDISPNPTVTLALRVHRVQCLVAGERIVARHVHLAKVDEAPLSALHANQGDMRTAQHHGTRRAIFAHLENTSLLVYKTLVLRALQGSCSLSRGSHIAQTFVLSASTGLLFYIAKVARTAKQQQARTQWVVSNHAQLISARRASGWLRLAHT
jgi:hypothetical protein